MGTAFKYAGDSEALRKHLFCLKALESYFKRLTVAQNVLSTTKYPVVPEVHAELQCMRCVFGLISWSLVLSCL